MLHPLHLHQFRLSLLIPLPFPPGLIVLLFGIVLQRHLLLRRCVCLLLIALLQPVLLLLLLH